MPDEPSEWTSLGPSDYESIARQAATAHNLDPDFVARIGKQESGWNPHAKSPKGATGIMQLMPHTAAGLGVDPHDPIQNIYGGVREIARLHKKYNGDQRLVAAGYNAGEGAVDKHGGVPPFRETQKYVNSVVGQDEWTPVDEWEPVAPPRKVATRQPDISKLPRLQLPESQRPGYQPPSNKPVEYRTAEGMKSIPVGDVSLPGRRPVVTDYTRGVYNALRAGVPGVPGSEVASSLIPAVGGALEGIGKTISGIPATAKDIADAIVESDWAAIGRDRSPTDDPVNKAMESAGQTVTRFGEQVSAGASPNPITDIAHTAGEAAPMILAAEAGGLPAIAAQTFAESRGSGESAPKAAVRTAANIAGLGLGSKLATRLGGNYLARVFGYTVGQETVTQVEQAIEQGRLPDPKQVGLSTFKNALFNAGFAVHGGAHKEPRSTAHTPLGEAHDPTTVAGEVAADANTLPSQMKRLMEDKQDVVRVAEPDVMRKDLPVKKGQLESQGIGITRTEQGWFAHKRDKVSPAELKARVKAEADQAEWQPVGQEPEQPQPSQSIKQMDADLSKGGDEDAGTRKPVQPQGRPTDQPYSGELREQGPEQQGGGEQSIRSGREPTEGPQAEAKEGKEEARGQIDQVRELLDKTADAKTEVKAEAKDQIEELRKKRIEEGRKFRLDCSKQGGRFTIPGV